MHKKLITLLLIILTLLLAVMALAGCKTSPQQAPSTTPHAAVSGGNAAAPPPALDHAPAQITVQTALRPAIDPACLEDKGKFVLTSAPLPRGGLEPGMVHVFCAVGAPAGEMVTFTLKSPDGTEQSFQAPSVDQGAVNVAVQPITIGADAKPGKWTLSASYQDKKDTLKFEVKPASQPFIVLAEPIGDDPRVIRVAIGGLPAGAYARFAIYRLEPGQTENGVVQSHGVLLLENEIQTDEEGRADLALDVIDQPEGPYLLTLLPEGDAAAASTVIQLPEQERTALSINIHRANAAAAIPEQTGEQAQPVEQQTSLPEQPVTYAPQSIPPAPVPAEAGGGLPQTVHLSLPDSSLPPCDPTSKPALQFWPSSGEVGQWWLGCASGYTPNRALRVDATLGNGATTSFDLTKTEDDGTKYFRWYGLPEEGTGEFTITVSDLTGNTAKLLWRIDPATRPHMLVYPHVVIKGMDAKLYLTGFKKRARVQVGVYRIDDAGVATLVDKLSVKTNKQGVFGQTLDIAQNLDPGAYMMMAQSASAYQFSGIDTPATAIEFFSVGIPLAEKYEFYTLFVGRGQGSSVVSATGGGASGLPDTGEEAAAPAQGATPVPSAAPGGIPSTLSIPADNSAPPTCPGAQPDEPSICLMPDTIERAEYVYMLMHGFKPGTQFLVTVATPRGGNVKLNVRADENGIADAHWYALNNEKLGTYRVNIRGGGKRFRGAFKIVKATSPHLVVQPRSPKVGQPVTIAISGLEPTTTYTLARYRSTGEAGGQIQFELMDTKDIPTGKGGGAQMNFANPKKDADALFLAVLYEKGGSQPLAQEVYAPAQELYLRYPFAWGGK